MDWRDIAATVGKTAPLLGTLLGGPGGAAIGGIISSVLGTASDPDAVLTALANSPDAAVKLRQIEADRQTKLAELATDQAKAEIAGAVQAAGDVNKTMQAEAASEHWPTYTWRPFIGFVFGLMGATLGITVAACYLGVMFFGGKPETLATLPAMLGAMVGVMGVMSPILGIASWFRGRMQADPNVPTDNRG
jgi:hypothetical protein